MARTIHLKSYPRRLPKRPSLLARLELPRKVFHSIVGFLAWYIYTNNWPTHIIKILVVTLSAFCFSIEFLRFKCSALNRFMFWLMGSLSRSNELTQFTGCLYYFLGINFAVFCLPRDLAFLCIMYVAWCDPMASLVGKLIGHYTFTFSNRKSVAGLAGAFSAAYWITVMFYSRIAMEISFCQEMFTLNQWAIISGIVVAVSEIIDLKGLDDNLTIPLLSGTVLFAISKLSCLYLK